MNHIWRYNKSISGYQHHLISISNWRTQNFEILMELGVNKVSVAAEPAHQVHVKVDETLEPSFSEDSALAKGSATVFQVHDDVNENIVTADCQSNSFFSAPDLAPVDAINQEAEAGLDAAVEMKGDDGVADASPSGDHDGNVERVIKHDGIYLNYDILGGSTNPFLSMDEKESDLCCVKTITEVSPQLITRKDGLCQGVKDICVDEGVPLKENLGTENGELEEKKYVTLADLVFNDKDHFSGIQASFINSVPDEKTLLSKIRHHSVKKKESAKNAGIEKLVEVCDEPIKSQSDEKSTEESDFLVQTFQADDVGDATLDMRQVHQNQEADNVSESQPQGLESNHEKGEAVQDRSNNINGEALAKAAISQGPQLLLPRREEWGSGRRSSAVDPADVSGYLYPGSHASITYSGPIPYSGSISLRSDSSTTSTRSFAFPVLASEWNCSPVKMAKADRRHLRKHRGWRMALLCCRF